MFRKHLGLTARLLLVPAVALASAADASAQRLPWQVGGGFGYEFYSFADPDASGIQSLSLATAPFAAQSLIGRGLSLQLSGSFASGTFTRADGSEASISALTDTEVRATLPLERNGATAALTAVVILPTGFTGYSLAQAELAGAIAADLLPFRVSNWGGGGGAAMAVSVARPFGDVNLGASAGYRVASEFEPLAESDIGYLPGNELRIRVGADRSFGARKASLHATLLHYGEDRFEGTNLFRSGNRYQLVGSYGLPVGFGASAVLYAGMLHRAQGTALDTFIRGSSSLEDAPSQTLLLFGSAARVPSRFGLLLPGADVRMFRREDGVGQGYLVGLGAASEQTLMRSGAGGRDLVLVPSLRLRFGNLMAGDGVESGFAGAEMGLTMRFGEVTR